MHCKNITRKISDFELCSDPVEWLCHHPAFMAHDWYHFQWLFWCGTKLYCSNQCPTKLECYRTFDYCIRYSIIHTSDIWQKNVLPPIKCIGHFKKWSDYVRWPMAKWITVLQTLVLISREHSMPLHKMIERSYIGHQASGISTKDVNQMHIMTFM